MSKRRKRITVIGGVVLLALVIGTTAVLASGGDRISGPPTVTATGKGLCASGVAIDTRQVVFEPVDAVTANNTASTLTVQNKCSRAFAAVTVSTETGTTAGGYIHADVRATCLSGCPAGTILGSPGNTYLNNTPSTNHTASGIWAFDNLPKGTWRFDFGVAGNGTSFVEYRTMEVAIYKK
jgi:hypothetical protein